RELLAEASLSYGLKFLALGRPIEAERFLLSVTSIHPENVDVHRGLAGIYYDRGAMSHALAHLEQWAALDTSDGRPHRFMGLIYKDQGDNTAAADHYRAALRLRLAPRVRKEVVAELAEVLIQLHEYAEALQHLDDCLREPGAPAAALLELRAESLYGLQKDAEV